ncbi:MAG: HAD family hydrolase [Syntrophobacteraceae bacterium]|nr:HAD family hydrolase [Syntrophobacteraceae bacterium]
MLVWIGYPRPSSPKFLFLDRDGVINVDSSRYVKSWEEFHFYPDALDALRFLRERSVHAILISNQSVVNRGLMTLAQLWELHGRMVREIRQAGGDLLAAFYCPHRPDENCSCRKPLPRMVHYAAELFSIDPAKTYLIGDRKTDILAAGESGCKSILVERSDSEHPPEGVWDGWQPEERYPTILDAVKTLWEQGKLS